MTQTPKMTWEEALEHVAEIVENMATSQCCLEALAVLRASHLQPRDEVLEEAAMVAEQDHLKWYEFEEDALLPGILRRIAAAIRALKKG